MATPALAMTSVRPGSPSAQAQFARLGLLVLLGACSPDQFAVELGAVAASVTTSGAGTDPDGYFVGVDGVVTRGLPDSGRVVLGGLSAGDHRVSLSGWTPNCSPIGADAMTVSIAGTDTVSATFQVGCDVDVGSLQVSVASTGSDFDPSGYALTVDGGRQALMKIEDTYVLNALSGQHTIGLEQVTVNCAMNDNPRTVTIPFGGSASTRFDVTCEPAPPAGPGNEILMSVFGLDGLIHLILMNSDGTGRREITPDEYIGLGPPAWNPDGTKIAFSATASQEEQASIVVAGADGTIESQVTGIVELSQGTVTWSADGSELVFVAFDADCSRPRAFGLRLGESVPYPLALPCSSEDTAVTRLAVWSPDGSQLALTRAGGGEEDSSATWIEVSRLDGSVPRVLVPDVGSIRSLAWSPDGTRLVFAATPTDDFSLNIYLLDLASGVSTPLTAGPSLDFGPSWSPDGSSLVFSSDRDGDFEIYLMGADGRDVQPLTSDPLSNFDPAWRPGP